MKCLKLNQSCCVFTQLRLDMRFLRFFALCIWRFEKFKRKVFRLRGFQGKRATAGWRRRKRVGLERERFGERGKRSGERRHAWEFQIRDAPEFQKRRVSALERVVAGAASFA